MRRIGTTLFLCAWTVLVGSDAGAVVQGTASSRNNYTVRLAGDGYCTGVVISLRLVATAAHCASRAMRIYAGGRSFAVAAIVRSAVLDDGRQVAVTGDAAILRTSRDLPGVTPIQIGSGEGERFIIAGYGTTDERWRGSFGKLREAELIAAEPFALVDPNRSGSISASACFGDSGGPVLRGESLVGIITRAAHPSPRIACGDLTRWAPIAVGGAAEIAATISAPAGPSGPARRKPRKIHSAAVSETRTAAWLFGTPEPNRRAHRHKPEHLFTPPP